MIRSGAFLLCFVLVVAGCGGSLGAASKAPASARPSSRLSASSARPSASSKPSANPDMLAAKIAAFTKSVRRSGTASVTLKTSSGAECGISVDYPSGPSTASGLEPAKADKAGSIVWKWKVASDTPKGTWPIVVSCTLGGRYGETRTTFAVK